MIQYIMVLIISDRVEETEMEVYDWIKSFNKNCKIISTDDFFKKFSIEYKPNTLILFLNNKGEKDTFVKTIWMRRDRFSLKNYFNNDAPQTIISNLESEADTLKDILLGKAYHNVKILSSYSNKKLNKLKVLKKAQEIGLKIPDYIITNKKCNLESFLNIHRKIICKASYENLSFDENSKRYFQYVEPMDKNLLYKIPDTFFPSFFQKYIPQKYEIRAFYLNGEIHAMANILSKGLEGDIRRVNFISRKIPYKFEKEEEIKIMKLMNELNLTIGALDFIIDYDDNLYFLEVNPNGNFLVVSKKCNYNLEEKVAKYLINGEY